MNVQRGIIYKQRDDVLNGEDMSDTVKKMILRSIETNVDLFTSGEPENWNLKGLRDQYLGWLTTEDDLNYSARELDEIDEKDIVDTLYQKAMQIYNKNIEQYGEALMNDVERNILLRTVDRNWMEHIDAMEELKRGIHLRGYGQHDPVNEYRNDGGDMFDAMISAIQEETAKAILCVKIKTGDEIKREQVSKAEKFTNGQSDKGTVSAKPKGPSKNGLCPCGSGKKYKRCCGKNEQ